MTSPREIEEILEEVVHDNTVQSRGENHTGRGEVGTALSQSLLDAGTLFTLGSATQSVPEWTIYPAMRDRVLRHFYKTEPIVAGAVYSMSTRIKSMGWDLAGEEGLQDDIKALFKAMDFGNGFRSLVQKTVIDLCTQDNGFFWELIGMGDPDSELLGGVVLGVNYLDPAQCYRTFDSEYPVLYINPITGKRHRLHHSRVVSGSSMPMPNELARGVGYCAISRVLLSMQSMKSISQYRYEKTSGQFERAIGYGTGVTQATMRQLLQQVASGDEGDGFIRFGKIPFYVSPRKDVEFNILDLASIPDGFNLVDEINTYVYTVALGFGVDAREFWTATQSGATKADASIQHLKSQGKGLADLITIIEDKINLRVLPDGMEFAFAFQDDEQDSLVQVRNTHVVNNVKNMLADGLISKEQGQAILITEGVLDEAVLQEAGSIAILPEEEVPDALPAPDDPFAEDDPSIEEEDDEENTEVKTQAEMERQLRSAARAFVEASHTESSLVSEMDSIIRRQYMKASQSALKAVGMSQGDLTKKEIGIIQGLVADEQVFVVPFVKFVSALVDSDDFSWDKIFNRISMWANRYIAVRAKILAVVAKDKKLKWSTGKTEHCIDCFNFDGLVYRASVWKNRTPRSHSLACGGFRCQCDLEPTTDPASKGRPPLLRGRTKLHTDKWVKTIIGIERMLGYIHSTGDSQSSEKWVFDRFWIGEGDDHGV